jgi:hypothetical protein
MNLIKVNIVVARHYYHGGDGLEKLQLVFLPSVTEYYEHKVFAPVFENTYKQGILSAAYSLDAMVDPEEYYDWKTGVNKTKPKFFIEDKDLDQIARL